MAHCKRDGLVEALLPPGCAISKLLGLSSVNFVLLGRTSAS